MWIILISVLGCYAVAAAIVHLLKLRRQPAQERQSQRAKQVIIFTYNNEPILERYVRELKMRSLVDRTTPEITVIDQGSNDRTVGIARCFGDDINLVDNFTDDGLSAEPERSQHLFERLGIKASDAVVVHLAEAGQ